MRRPLFTALLLAAVWFLSAAGWIKWWQGRQEINGFAFTRQRLAFLEAETKRLHRLLASQKQVADAADAHTRRKEIEGTVEELRSLRFLTPVTYREIPRSDLPAILRQKLGQQVPDQEFGRTSVALAALGLIPRGLDLKRTYLALLGEQVGAFYDQHSRELFTFSGQPLASTQNRVILAHELTHALEDQHFHLERLPLETKGNDDRALAASALVEGDATLVMNRYMIDNLSADALRETLATAITTDVRQLAAAPRYLRETLLFPYLRGQEFCQALYSHGGWPALADAFARPPSCSSQILHPERFLAQPREEPVSIEFPAQVMKENPPVADNVLGEFGLRQLLTIWLKDEKRATALASGWSGDRYVVYGDAKSASYVWETVWRTPGEAAGFADAATDTLSGIGQGREPESVPTVMTTPSNYRERIFQKNGRYFLVALDGTKQRTMIIDTQDSGWFEVLKSRFATNFETPDTASPAQP